MFWKLCRRMRLAEVFQILLLACFCSCKKHGPSGSGQSPINIDSDTAQPLSCCPLPLMLLYDLMPGSTVNVSVSDNTVLVLPNNMSGIFMLYGGPLHHIYTFYGLHFHWGPSDYQGSEHAIKQIRMSMEAHFVFYKLRYGSKSEAMKHPDGLVVLAAFLQGGNEKSENFQPIVEKVKLLQNRENQTVSMQSNETFGWLMNNFPKGDTYYTYAGSLTTPPYSENVQWIIFDLPRTVSSDQVQAFRDLNSGGSYILANNRPLQPVKDRTIYYSHNYHKSP